MNLGWQFYAFFGFLSGRRDEAKSALENFHETSRRLIWRATNESISPR